MMQERAGTGRIYIQNVDHCNTYSPFDPSVAPVRQSNLCLEIALPTKPLNNVDDEDGEIALCTLSRLQPGRHREAGRSGRDGRAGRARLDALPRLSDYPLKAAKKGSMNRRTLGIGVINYAYYLAKTVPATPTVPVWLTHRTFEAIQYYLLKASVQLVASSAPARPLARLHYAQGIRLSIPIKGSDVPCAMNPCTWTGKPCAKIKTVGLRNSTLTALMPSETSSQISNATNGIEPPAAWCR